MAQVSLSRKRELMEPDAVEVFLKNLFEKAFQYKTQLIIGLVVLFAVVGTVSGIYYHLKTKAANASLELGQMVSQYEGENGDEHAFPEVSSRYKIFLDTYSGTRAAEFAGLRYANLCYQEGQFDEAISYYKKSLKNFSDNRALITMIQSNLGYAYLAKKEYETAKSYFEKVTEEKGMIDKEEGLFNLGLIYGLNGDQEKKEACFNQIKALDKSSIYTELVKEEINK